AQATGVNGAGTVVGWSFTAGFSSIRAFSYASGAMTDLGTLGGVNSGADGIDASGRIVGRAETGDGPHHAFLRSGGVMADLGTLGGPESVANSINASGEVVGWADTGAFTFHAFVWSGGALTDLGTLGGLDSSAIGIDGTGRITGDSLTAGGLADDAFLWSAGS